jgi:hypothetical protein
LRQVNHVGDKCSTRNTEEKRRPGVDGRGRAQKEQFPEAEMQRLAIDRVAIARELVLAAWADLIQGQISKAKEGGYQQFKLLIDLCGLKIPDESEQEAKQRQTLCDVLLEGLTLSPRADRGISDEDKDAQESD